MIYGMFSIYDSKAEAFLPPFILPKTSMAQRAFADCANSDTHQFAANPEDYTLMKLGNWDDENASFDPMPTPTSLGLALEYVTYDNAGDIIPGKQNGRDQTESESQDSHVRSDSESANIEK